MNKETFIQDYTCMYMYSTCACKRSGNIEIGLVQYYEVCLYREVLVLKMSLPSSFFMTSPPSFEEAFGGVAGPLTA